MLWVGLGLKPCDHLLRLSGLVQSTESPVQAKWEARLHETEEHAYSSPRKDQKQIVTGMKQQGSGFRVSGKQTQIWFWRGDSLLDGINNTNMSVIEILPHKEPRMATHHPAFEWGKWCSENYTHTHTHTYACMHTHTHTHTPLHLPTPLFFPGVWFTFSSPKTPFRIEPSWFPRDKRKIDKVTLEYEAMTIRTLSKTIPKN